ncbi:MAG TPA: WGR domain-containing protein [Vicinamibacteria bacterium]|nr:WGR domain-containing protein [Vicinamibacteria bacterium]
MLSLATDTADSLVEKIIFVSGNKVMVMRATGGGNVCACNYFDNGYIGNYLGWMETGLNASHLTCPHFELLEGNQAFNIDGDDTAELVVSFDRIGTTGQIKRKTFPNESLARHEAEALIREKIGKGYQEVQPR